MIKEPLVGETTFAQSKLAREDAERLDPSGVAARLASCSMNASCDWKSLLPGKFVVFDGPDGSGKTTQFRQLADAARAAGVETVEVREPGGTAIGEKIRAILLDPIHAEMVTRCEMLLYMASRAQLVEERVRPALARGAFVLADRFISSTLAYQGTAGGIDRASILAIGEIAIGGRWPDLVVVFDVDSETAARRVSPTRDRMEQKDRAYHTRVRDGYLDQAKADPQHYLVIDATRAPEQVYASLVEGLVARLAAAKRA